MPSHMCDGRMFNKEEKRDVFDQYDAISPIDYRYHDEEVAKYLSENAFTRYKLRVEVALIEALHERGICSETNVQEIQAACAEITTEEVYAEEHRIKHDIRALVNCIQRRVSEETRPFVHLGATSYDIIDTANAMRYRDLTEKVLVGALRQLMHALYIITQREAHTAQIGRTHGQHAVPITFGYFIAGYMSRLGQSIERLSTLATELPGKFSGAVGAYNAGSILFPGDPITMELEILYSLDVYAAEHATQVVQPEPLIRLFSEIVLAGGILADLADDIRHLQRTEIAEVGEEFEANQVGSSTMPQKRNPINLENIKSMWKTIVPRLLTLYMDQLSEHQRDLTNSAAARTYGEIIAYVVSMTKRMTRVMRKLKVHHKNVTKNLSLSKGMILAEPLYLLFAKYGHPDSHEAVRALTLQAERDQKPLIDILQADPALHMYFEKMSNRERRIIADPTKYIGRAARGANEISQHWHERLKL